jgi:hypothetical protein
LFTDFAAPNSFALKKLSDSRAIQFWDKDHLVSRELQRVLAAHGASKPNCCELRGTLWDVAAVYDSQSRWSSGMPPPTFIDGPVGTVKDAVRRRLLSPAADARQGNGGNP